MASGNIVDPQTFNRYAYVRNNRLNLIDPTGMMMEINKNAWEQAERLRRLQDLVRQAQQSASKAPYPWVIKQDPKNHELTSRGWNFRNEDSVLYDGTDHGGKELVYCKKAMPPVSNTLDDKRRSLVGLSRLR